MGYYLYTYYYMRQCISYVLSNFCWGNQLASFYTSASKTWRRCSWWKYWNCDNTCQVGFLRSYSSLQFGFLSHKKFPKMVNMQEDICNMYLFFKFAICSICYFWIAIYAKLCICIFQSCAHVTYLKQHTTCEFSMGSTDPHPKEKNYV